MKDLKDLLPQKKPMVMVSHQKNDSIFLEIKENNIFLDNDVFQEAGILEHIAQAVILYVYSKKNAHKEDFIISLQPKIGKILNSKFEKEVQKNDTLETKIKILFQDKNLLAIEGTSFVRDEKVAYSEMLLIL
jgi:3-hydroxymyristoyl/3-hydroxydecanoyl-(acyl carrier protein) dehydratase